MHQQSKAMKFLSARVFILTSAMSLAWVSQAGSFVGSSADSGVQSSQGSSDSIKLSSNSSADDQTAAIRDGAYRIAAVQEESDQWLLQLQPEHGQADAQAFQLQVPRPSFDGQPRVGETIHARQRAYGVQFVRGHEQTPFFLVMADAVQPELATRAL